MISNSPISKNNGIDLFNFKHYAKKVQKIIQNNSNNSEPLTIGIYGKWGEGKTSFLNLINDEIDIWKDKEKGQKGILKYHFNPWRYSTEEEMLFDFFDGLSKIMFVDKKNETLQKISKKITEYYNYIEKIKLKGKVGFFLKILNFFAEISKKDKVTLDKIIKSINDKLKGLSYKIVVFIDDIDRLDKDEIYTILKLIKLNANFDNFVYIVALDENHVAKAIGQRYGETSDDGKLFLEKIINIPIHLPKIESADFKQFFDLKLKEVIDNLGFSNRKEEINEIRNEFKFHYFKNAREIIRVLNSFFVGAFAIGEEVNLKDLFWIEYLKVTDNESYCVIKNKSFRNWDLMKNYTIFDFFRDSSTLSTNVELPKGSSSTIIFMLFPEKDNNNRYLDKKEQYITKINKTLRINSINHFDKYFSHHTVRKISEIKKKLIIQNIKDENEILLKQNLLEVKGDVNLKIYLFYDLLESLIKEEKSNQEFFYNFFFLNLEMIPEKDKDVFEETYRLRLIGLISEAIDKASLDINLPIDILNIDELFKLMLTKKSNLKNRIEKDILKRIKNELNIQQVSLIDYSYLSNYNKITVMFIFKEHDEEVYKKDIFNNLKNIEDIKNMISIFKYNNKGIEVFNIVSYKQIESLIIKEVIYQKIEEFNPDLIKKIGSTYVLSSKDKSSDLENVEQFIYWYKKDKNLIN
ncbi:KAP family P-loop NTPase fold protein [Tenacibaculum finnmarkense]|uniref:KAP family P-loop NTPase fold protein n=1 Tax=Tenacibaculum finnmarkense TaxID=2781243 RepID=UPI001E2E0CAC|nr:P-loop NTPase fold protein [Tenacibaculum finnmarkense]MCD8409313.1 KAP family NTPase [Tenacibaculum finnmarkense genomovar ulcerans]